VLLGDRFLGHVERTAVLLHLIDSTQDNIVDAYNTIRNEMEEYGNGLSDKPAIIALNKCDAIGPELAEDQAQILRKAIGKEVLTISAVSGDNVQKVLFALAKEVANARV